MTDGSGTSGSRTPECLAWTLKNRQCRNNARAGFVTCGVRAHAAIDDTLRAAQPGSAGNTLAGGARPPRPPPSPSPAQAAPEAQHPEVPPCKGIRPPDHAFPVAALAEAGALLAPTFLLVAASSNFRVSSIFGFDYLQYAKAPDHEQLLLPVSAALLAAYAFLVIAARSDLLRYIFRLEPEVRRAARKWRAAHGDWRLARDSFLLRCNQVEALESKLPSAAPMSAMSVRAKLEAVSRLREVSFALLIKAWRRDSATRERLDFLQDELLKRKRSLDGGHWAQPGFILGNPRVIFFVGAVAVAITLALACWRVNEIDRRPFRVTTFENGDSGCYKVVQTLQESTFLLRATSVYSSGPGCADNVRVARGDSAEREVVKTADIRRFEGATPQDSRPPALDAVGPGLSDIAAAIRERRLIQNAGLQSQPDGLIVNELRKSYLRNKTINQGNPVYWKEFASGEFSLRGSVLIESAKEPPGAAVLEALALREIAGISDTETKWRRDETGKLDIVSVKNDASLLDEAALVNFLATAAAGDPVQVIGFADARGQSALNSALSHYRAIAMKVILDSAAKSAGRPLKFQVCFAGERWEGADHVRAEETPWLRRVEIRYGDNRLNVTGCVKEKAETANAETAAARQ